MDDEERALGRGVRLRSSGFGYGLPDVSCRVGLAVDSVCLMFMLSRLGIRLSLLDKKE